MRWQMPKTCPSCAKPLTRPEGYVDHYCLNPDCREQVVARLKHATGKSALDIDGCGDAMIEELVKHGVRDMADLFNVDPATLGLKPAAKKKFVEGRIKALEAPLWRKLHALGIDGFGRTLCQEVAARWRNLGDVYEDEEKFKELVGQKHFDEFMASMIYEKAVIENLEKTGFKFEDADRIEGPLSGKVFVITGDLQSGRREEVTHWIEQAGGLVKSSVSKKCNYLVAGDNAGKTKTDAAAKHGTVVITEQSLLQMLGREMPALESTNDEEEI